MIKVSMYRYSNTPWAAKSRVLCGMIWAVTKVNNLVLTSVNCYRETSNTRIYSLLICICCRTKYLLKFPTLFPIEIIKCFLHFYWSL